MGQTAPSARRQPFFWIRVAALFSVAMATGAGGLRAADRPVPGASAPLTIDALRATRERPLFAPSRRPPSERVPAAPISQAPTTEHAAEGDFDGKLVGVIQGGAVHIAVIYLPSIDRSVTLQRGATLSGWRLASVASREAVLEKDGRQTRLALPEREIAPSGNAPPAGAGEQDRGLTAADGAAGVPPLPLPQAAPSLRRDLRREKQN